MRGQEPAWASSVRPLRSCQPLFFVKESRDDGGVSSGRACCSPSGFGARYKQECDCGRAGEGYEACWDTIPWIMSQQVQEGRFGRMSGARVVWLACHPECIGESDVFSFAITLLLVLSFSFSVLRFRTRNGN